MLSGVQDAERRVTESGSQLSRFLRLKSHQEAVARSLQGLQSKLDVELARVTSTIKDASDIFSFISKASAKSFIVEGISEVTGLIDRLRNEIDPSST